MSVVVLRTPEERFQELPGYPFAARYVEVGDGLRMHYVDEGPREAPPVLLLHGEPSWSYLYRKMIPPIAAAGFRAIAPDLIGFGKSDKPAAREDYSYQLHVDWIRDFIEALDLRHVTLVCQDWGGLIGLRLVAEHPERFGAVVAANTFLPTGDRAPAEAFLKWREFSQKTPEFKAGRIVAGAVVTPLAPEVIAAYDAPFPDESFKAGARAFPMLVPIAPDDPAAEANRRAWEVLRFWKKAFVTAFSDGDPITAGGDRVFQKLIPGCVGQAHVTIRNAGHFLQEDAGEELAAVAIEAARAEGRLKPAAS